MSSKPESFVLTSDFATLKNDGTATFTVSLPGGVSLAAGATYSASQTLQVGAIGASERARIASSKDSNRFYSTLSLSITRNGTSGGFPAPYSVFALLRRSGATSLVAEVLIYNPYGDSLICEGGAETFTFEVNTFLSPFPA